MAVAVLIASGLRKELAGNLLFDGVSFKVERRDRVALSGPNGAGKTTLLRMLAGQTDVHGGELAFEKGARVALHDQRPPLERELTLREYVLAGAADLLRLDEPTNHLDVESLEWLEKELETLDAAVMLVAHDRWFLEAVTNAVLELSGGRSIYFPGSWHTWRLEKAARALDAQKEV